MNPQPVLAQKTRVLVVDDRHENRFLLQSILEGNGFEVQLAANGEEAIQLVRRSHPELIISDITMPKMDGFRLCRLVKTDEQLRHILFVFCTATYTEEKDERFALSLGADDFLVKPIDPFELVARIKHILERNEPISSRVMSMPSDELEYLREYSQRLVEKLERKMAEVENANRELQSLNTTLEQKVADRTAELEHKHHELAASNAELQAFAYTAAHDLRAPLRAIQGFANFLGEELAKESTPAAKAHLERIKRGAAQMDKLIQDLLDYSKVASTPVRLFPVALPPIVEEVMLAHQIEIQQTGARLEIELTEAKVQAVDVLLRQVLENLLDNALKFVPANTPPHVRIMAEIKESRVRISVGDNGIGISQEHQTRIFDVFERLHQQKVYPGTGIGLAIVRKAVERMGGTVGVESETGKGSCFWVELKRAP